MKIEQIQKKLQEYRDAKEMRDYLIDRHNECTGARDMHVVFSEDYKRSSEHVPQTLFQCFIDHLKNIIADLDARIEVLRRELEGEE